MSFRMEPGDDPFDIEGFKLVPGANISVCQECGYIYNDRNESVKFEDLPTTWECPTEDCALPKDYFKNLGIPSPETGIKINLNGESYFDEQKTFRFTDAAVSTDAYLSNLIVSNESDTYNLTKAVDEETLGDKDKQGFDKEILNYELDLLDNLDTINIKAIKSDVKSKIVAKVIKRGTDGQVDEEKIIYKEDNETEIKKEIPIEVTLNKLGEPDTEIEIKVTAEDRLTTNTYKVVIKRPYATIKGSIYTAPTADKGIYRADIRIYKTSDVERLIDWDTIVSGNSDDVHDRLLALESQNYKTNDDGTYEIYVIPGTYDILIDKAGYLDHIYISKVMEENETVDLGYKSLVPGDVDKNGVVEHQDISIVTSIYGILKTDSRYNVNADFNEDEEIQLQDVSTVISNYSQEREIIR